MTIKKSIFFLLASVVIMAHAPNPFEQVSDSREYPLKAAFLYNFIEYIEWDTIGESETFNIAVLGKSPITKQLQVLSKDKKAKDKQLAVREYENLDFVGSCHILFVSYDYPLSIEKIISRHGNKETLIVTEKKNYGKKGAHINFLIINNKLKFEVNLKAVNKSGLKISSQLLQHAIITDN